ncbi:MAG: DUF72 domain-containing protein, partial [Gammaproteobacteria bacterium]
MSGREPQPDLFGGGSQDPSAARAPRARAAKSGGVAPQPVDPALEAIATRLPTSVRFGTSTW